MEDRSLGFEIKLLNNMILRKIIKDSKEYGQCTLSPIQIKVVHYLIEHKNETIYQRDIEKSLMVRRSTVSGILKTMEKHQLIKKLDSK